MARFFTIIFIHLRLAHKIYWTNRRRSKNLIKELRKELSNNGNFLNNSQKTRIKLNTIYSTITNQWFSELIGNKPNKIEQDAALYWGALVPVIDDLTDEKKLSAVEILKELTGTNASDNNLVLSSRYLVKKLPPYFIETLNHSALQILEAQEASIKQLSTEKLSNDFLREITYSKGSRAALLYRLILKSSLKDGEKEAIYTLGYLLQLTNDLFDIYKDSQNQQQTLFTNATDFQALYTEFSKTYQNMCCQFLNLDYEKKNIKAFLLYVAIIKARAMVCFDQLIQCQRENGNKIELDKFTRKQLVCDMENFSNIIQSIKYNYQLYREIEELISNKKP